MTQISGENYQTKEEIASWNLLKRKVQEHRVLRIFEIFREQSIEPVLIKGFAAGVNYPDERLREFIDVDLAVSGADFERAEQLCKSPVLDGFAVDLHRELRHLDTMSWVDLVENSRVVRVVDGGSYRVLRAEDHLRVLCVHWLNDGGISKDRLWDIYYLISNRGDDFDWDRALNSVGPKRRRWLICTLGLAHRYLGLDLGGTPIEHEANEIPDWLIKSVEKEWAGGEKLIPLWLLTKDPKQLLRQMFQRLNPNPIRATVEMEGSFDARTRLFYKIGNFSQRLLPSLKRNIDTAGRT